MVKIEQTGQPGSREMGVVLVRLKGTDVAVCFQVAGIVAVQASLDVVLERKRRRSLGRKPVGYLRRGRNIWDEQFELVSGWSAPRLRSHNMLEGLEEVEQAGKLAFSSQSIEVGHS
jgi:hypothetical protein